MWTYAAKINRWGSYFMILIDVFTKFTAMYFLKKKSEAADCFQAYQTHVEKLHQGNGKNYVIKGVRTVPLYSPFWYPSTMSYSYRMVPRNQE